MLAQNFKTPADLEISDIEFESLVKVLGMLERGDLVYGKHPIAKQFRGANEFNMAATLNQHQDGPHCGTVACICGWAHVVSDRRAFAQFFSSTWETESEAVADMPINLRKLFRFGANLGSLFDITPEQAATALRNYLVLGEPNWAEARA